MDVALQACFGQIPQYISITRPYHKSGLEAEAAAVITLGMSNLNNLQCPDAGDLLQGRKGGCDVKCVYRIQARGRSD